MQTVRLYINFQSFLQFSSDKSSRFLFLLCESRAECLPRSSQESTYFVGSKCVRGGPTKLMNKSDETVFIISEALVGVISKFICENPLSHSQEEMEIVFRACIRGSILSEYING